jgi:O-antigen ligase
VKHDALSPSYILSGRGFGTVLAFEYGIETPRADGVAPLRSAHHSHLTILARTGLPGFGLWVLIWLVWIQNMVRWGLRGARNGWSASAALSALVLAAVVGYLVNTYFDPAVDGPKGAIWIWSLMALGAVYAAKSRSAALTKRATNEGGRPGASARSAG